MCSEVFCGDPPDVMDAYYEISTKYPVDSVVTYHCLPNKQFDRNVFSKNVSCDIYGDWKSPLMGCSGTSSLTINSSLFFISFIIIIDSIIYQNTYIYC